MSTDNYPSSRLIPTAVSRRRLMSGMSGGILSVTALGLLAGNTRLALAHEKGTDPAADAAIINGALASEYEAIAAYQVGAESGLLKKPALDLAVQFQGHHKAHAGALAAAVENLGGKPAGPRASYDFPVSKLKTDEDVLRFAAGLEKGAVSAYLAAVPNFADKDFSKVAASILGDEAMHWAVLRYVLGENPVPDAFVS